jgi:hypothetical protein
LQGLPICLGRPSLAALFASSPGHDRLIMTPRRPRGQFAQSLHNLVVAAKILREIRNQATNLRRFWPSPVA